MPRAPDLYLFADYEFDRMKNSAGPIAGFWDLDKDSVPFIRFHPYAKLKNEGMRLEDENLFEGLFSGDSLCYSSRVRKDLIRSYPINKREMDLSWSCGRKASRREFKRGQLFSYTQMAKSVRNCMIPVSSIMEGSFGLDQKSFNNQVGVELKLERFNGYLSDLICVMADPRYARNLYKFSGFKKEVLNYLTPKNFVGDCGWEKLAYLLYAGVLEYAS